MGIDLSKSPKLLEKLVRQGLTASPLLKAHKPRPQSRRILNHTEAKYRDLLFAKCYSPILEQAITLALDPPFQSYRPDLAYLDGYSLVFVECKAPHRFSERGIAKAACAAKTYPMFKFILAMWKEGRWVETVLSP